ncbi:MAG TPA: esterase [Isosphaeraceae bacterium]|nr:esterase [Isosphaeraceae bacterium]
MSSDRLNAPSFDTTTGAGTLVEARFIPQRYEPNYAYPLLVLFHARGCDEQQMVRSMPALSWRNYVGLSLRGPESATKRGRPEGYGWGPAFARPEREAPRPAPTGAEGEQVRRRLFEAAPDPIDLLEDGVFASIRQTRRALHVHSERIFLVGCGEGAAVAYRIGLSYPERFAGVVAINGWLPGSFRPLARLKDCRDLRILVVHGEWNGRAPVQSARRDVAMLRAGGLRVAFQSYPCAHRLTSPMLSDVDTWLINRCTSEL